MKIGIIIFFTYIIVGLRQVNFDSVSKFRSLTIDMLSSASLLFVVVVVKSSNIPLKVMLRYKKNNIRESNLYSLPCLFSESLEVGLAFLSKRSKKYKVAKLKRGAKKG